MDETVSPQTSTNEPDWSWSAAIKDDTLKCEYRGFVTISNTNEQIDVHFSDGEKSLVGSATKASLSHDKSTPHAFVNPDRHIEMIKRSLESHSVDSNGSGPVRIICERGDNASGSEVEVEYALRIAAPWGTEFGLENFFIDIATLKLEQVRHNRDFLSAVFQRIRDSRSNLEKSRSRAHSLNVELKDLTIAQKYLKEMLTAGAREKRLQTLSDTINAYKLKCSEGKG